MLSNRLEKFCAKGYPQANLQVSRAYSTLRRDNWMEEWSELLVVADAKLFNLEAFGVI